MKDLRWTSVACLQVALSTEKVGCRADQPSTGSGLVHLGPTMRGKSYKYPVSHERFLPDEVE